MRTKDYDLLGKLITAANQWRSATNTAGGSLESITVKFPNKELVVLEWLVEYSSSTDPNTGAEVRTPVWEGWDIKTKVI